MKCLKFENTIVSLENVREVHLTEYGTGAKSSPRHSSITVHYTNTNETSGFTIGNETSDYSRGYELLDHIYLILQSE